MGNDPWNSFVVLVMMGMLTVTVIHSRQTGTTTAAEVNVLAIIQDVIRNAPSRKLVGWDLTQTCITVAMTGRRLVHCPIHQLTDQLLHHSQMTNRLMLCSSMVNRLLLLQLRFQLQIL